MKIIKIRFADNRIYGTTDDGRELWQSLLYYKRLRNASDQQREQYTINAYGIRWDGLDEDISFESFEYPDPEPTGLSRFFLTHDELNVSSIARRLGISQSLLSQYISGTKKPSEARRNEIVQAVHAIGRELSSASF